VAGRPARIVREADVERIKTPADDLAALVQPGGQHLGLCAFRDLLDHREDLVVILAGYKDRMDSFFASNPGMSFRIAHHIDVPDYTLLRMRSTPGWYPAVPTSAMIVSVAGERRDSRDDVEGLLVPQVATLTKINKLLRTENFGLAGNGDPEWDLNRHTSDFQDSG
jgi:hypothetical protein